MASRGQGGEGIYRALDGGGESVLRENAGGRMSVDRLRFRGMRVSGGEWVYGDVGGV